MAGGQYGHCPQLASPGTDNEDDLCMTYDFRDFYGTMLNRWLDVDETALEPGPGKTFPTTTAVDDDGNSYTPFTPINFLP